MKDREPAPPRPEPRYEVVPLFHHGYEPFNWGVRDREKGYVGVLCTTESLARAVAAVLNAAETTP